MYVILQLFFIQQLYELPDFFPEGNAGSIAGLQKVIELGVGIKTDFRQYLNYNGDLFIKAPKCLIHEVSP